MITLPPGIAYGSRLIRYIVVLKDDGSTDVDQIHEVRVQDRYDLDQYVLINHRAPSNDDELAVVDAVLEELDIDLVFEDI